MVGIKKIFIAIMIIVAGTHAAVLTHQETFNDVKVISPAKSTKTTCKTRVDLSEGLVDNTLGCDIEKILVYNKDRMWIGSLAGVEAGYHSRYNDYDIFRYKDKGKQISVEYAFTPQDAAPSNRWMVSCPKGMIAYIDYVYLDGEGDCYDDLDTDKWYWELDESDVWLPRKMTAKAKAFQEKYGDIDTDQRHSTFG